MARSIRIRPTRFRVCFQERERIDPDSEEGRQLGITGEEPPSYYVHELRPGEVPPGGGTVFVLQPIPHDTSAKYLTLSAEGKLGQEQVLDTITKALVNWEGMEDEDGNPVPFSRDLIKQGRIPYLDILDPLAAFVLRKAMTDRGEDVRKNGLSGTSPGTRPSGGSDTTESRTA